MGTEVRCVEQVGSNEIVRFRVSLFDPSLQDLPSFRRGLELEMAVGLVQQDDAAGCNRVRLALRPKVSERLAQALANPRLQR